MPQVLLREATDGPPLELPDKSVLLTSYGKDKDLIDNNWEWGRWVIGVFRSLDRGATWRLLSKVVTDRDLEEESMVRLNDGRLVMITRPEGAISWSEDNGHTWTPPVTFGFRLSKEIFHVSQAQGNPLIQPERVGDDLRREAMASID